MVGEYSGRRGGYFIGRKTFSPEFPGAEYIYQVKRSAAGVFAGIESAGCWFLDKEGVRSCTAPSSKL